MCTLTVAAADNSYRLAMNRDETLLRGAGMPPVIHATGGTKSIYPSDGKGGTWIAANECGIGLALLNWNGVTGGAVGRQRAKSRGQVIPALIDSRSLSDLDRRFDTLDLHGMLPFRLAGVFPFEREIREWRWDAVRLRFDARGWQSRHWFSSSLSDEQAESMRAATCREARREPDAGAVSWLRRLHASHVGGPGPFSICVHREDVRTLSYSEVMCTPGIVEMRHYCGSPCAMGPLHPMEIERARRSDFDVCKVGSPLL